jgi:hypothetical protein
MKLESFTFKIIGISPLLSNSCEHVLDQLGKDATIKKKNNLTDEQVAARSVRLDKTGYWFPAQGFRSAMDYAMGGKKIGKRSARMVLSAAVFNTDEKFYICEPPACMKPLKTFGIDKRMAITKQKQAIAVVRARFEKWGGQLALQIDTDMIPTDVVVESLSQAGVLAGIGSFRVACKGWFGKFTAELKK